MNVTIENNHYHVLTIFSNKKLKLIFKKMHGVIKTIFLVLQQQNRYL